MFPCRLTVPAPLGTRRAGACRERGERFAERGLLERLRTTTGLGHRDVLMDSSVIGDVVGFVTNGAERARKIA